MEGLLCAPTFGGCGPQLTWWMQWEVWAESDTEKKPEIVDEEGGCEDVFTARDGELARIGVVDGVGDGSSDVDGFGDRE